MGRDPAQHRSMAWLAIAAGVSCLRGGAARRARPAPATTLTPRRSRCSRASKEEALNWPFSRDLVDLLTSLGLAYQEHDRHDLALAMFDRALFLERFNDGLFGLDQAALEPRLVE